MLLRRGSAPAPRRGTRPPNPRLNAWRLYQIFALPELRAARASFGSPRPAGAAAAPPRSPRSGVIEVFVPARRRGTLHQPRTPVSGAMAVGLKKNSGLTRGVLTKFRLAQAPRGSRFLRSRRARGLYEGFCLIDAGQKYTPQYYSSMEKTLPFTSRRTAVSAISLAL